MEKPIKVVHRFKNNKNKLQYNIFIFPNVDDILDHNNIRGILEKNVKNNKLVDMLKNISKKDYSAISEYYKHNHWYIYFYSNVYLFNVLEEIVKENKTFLVNKFSIKWFDELLYVKSFIYDNSKDLIPLVQKGGNYNNNDTTYSTKDIINHTSQKGGNDTNDDLFNEKENNDNYININDIIKIYNEDKNTESKKTTLDTTKIISQVINDDKWISKIEKIWNHYDNTNDDKTETESLNVIYRSVFIYDVILKHDDSIHNIKSKISLSVPNIANIYLTPETQLLLVSKNGYKKIIGVGLLYKINAVGINELNEADYQIDEVDEVNKDIDNDKTKDSESLIFNYYKKFTLLNEVQLTDTYTYLGNNINSSDKIYIYTNFVSVYFPLISFSRFEQILNFLNKSNRNTEYNYVMNNLENIRNKIQIEVEVDKIVSEARKENINNDIKFYDNHIIQTIINVNINLCLFKSETKKINDISIFRIFDNFRVNNKYIFIQYAIKKDDTVYKFYSNKKSISQISETWFSTNFNGLSFKILIDKEKIITIHLSPLGKIDYKISWKEVEKITIDDINSSYNYIYDLIKKINKENNKIKILKPKDEDFNIIFFNSIMKFNLPNNVPIDHNVFSDFSRYFFPYVSIVIDPRRRNSNLLSGENKSKYGSYLRYKRVDNYENKIRIYLRILYFYRNYSITDKQVAEYVSVQFNITLEQAKLDIDFVKDKYNYILNEKKSAPKKSVNNIPKFKLPGIGIDIQGKSSDNYKIRILGAKSVDQLNDILEFIKILIFIYYQTYIKNKKKYSIIHSRLEGLTKIAKRKGKVNDIINADEDIEVNKKVSILDKKRLGFKPEKGKNQWSRSCQNSGNIIRRPEIFSMKQEQQIIKQGFSFNNKTGFYEKKHPSKKSTVLKAVRLYVDGDKNKGIYNIFTCNPKINGDYVYLGFLSKSDNPNNLCMPCCFKKDYENSDNQEKRDHFQECLFNKITENKVDKKIDQNTYILKNSNKGHDNKFTFLPDLLDNILNKLQNNSTHIEKHYLKKTDLYYLKYSIYPSSKYFLYSLSQVLDTTIDVIIECIEKALIRFPEYFIYINNGNIASRFSSIEDYISFIKNNDNMIEYYEIGELLSIPGVVTTNGINFYIFNTIEMKNNTKSNSDKSNEEESDFILNIPNIENINEYKNTTRDVIAFINYDIFYHPIYRIEKKTSEMKINKILNYKDDKFAINELQKYFNVIVNNLLISEILFGNILNCKNIITTLEQNNVKIKNQVVDTKYKCMYLVLDNDILLPVVPSGINYNYKYIENSKYNNLPTLSKINSYLSKLEKILQLNYTIRSMTYNSMIKSSEKYCINYVNLDNKLSIPIKNEYYKLGDLLGLPLEEDLLIDKEDNHDIINLKEKLFKDESYNLFRLEFSYYLTAKENNDIKDLIIKLVRTNDIISDIDEKRDIIRKIIFNITNKKLANSFNINDKNVKDDMVLLTKNNGDIKDYSIKNIREICDIYKTKDICNVENHCIWDSVSGRCKFKITQIYAVDFVNMILEECISDEIKFKELLHEGEYYVSDIFDMKKYSVKPEETIVSTRNININSILSNIFKRDDKKKKFQTNEYPIKRFKGYYLQSVLINNDSPIRAFVNGYFWLNSLIYNIDTRNLGYYSEIQENITKFLKAYIIDFIMVNINESDGSKHDKVFKKYLLYQGYKNELLDVITSNNSNNLYSPIIYYILSFIINIPIIVYDNYMKPIGLYYKGESSNMKYLDNREKYINVKEERENNVIYNISAAYYDEKPTK
jgi:hypothetical protein